jgi:hypothetical protein
MAVFNPYITTNTRLKRNKTAINEGATAGNAKTPRVGVNKSDLQAQGVSQGWSVRPLTMTEINQMSSAELRWHEEFNAENLAASFDKKARIEQSNQHQAAWDIKKKWDNVSPASDDDKKKMREVAEQFQRLYPQWIKNEANATALWNHMRKENLEPTKLASVIQAFEELAQQGKVSLNPSAISVGPERSISDTELTSHRNFHTLLQSHRRPTAEESMSADQYKALHPEVNSDAGGVPPLIQARIAKQKATEELNQRTESQTQRIAGHRITDYKSGEK